MGFTITGNETHLFITTDAGKFQFIDLPVPLPGRNSGEVFPASLKVGRQAQKRPKMLPSSLYLGRQEHPKRKTHKKRAAAAALFVPRAGLEPARPFRAKGFSYHYGFRHQGRRKA